MLRRLAVRDFVIVSSLELDFSAGFSVLTGETGAGKSILIDALQLALGGRGDALAVREGAARAEISAEFERPAAVMGWLEEAGFVNGEETLLLKRSIDAQGRSRAWINGGAATLAQLRQLADALVDIHGQHAWQSLTRPSSVRALLDARAGVSASALQSAWQAWKQAELQLEQARSRHDALAREREGLAWQVAELNKLAPGIDEWEQLDAEHRRLAHAQSLMDSAQGALQWVSEGEGPAEDTTSRAVDLLADVQDHDERLLPIIDSLRQAQTLLRDAAHSLNTYLDKADQDPSRLKALEERLSAWMSLARRFRRAPADLPTLLKQWEAELQSLEQASDLDALASQVARAEKAFREQAALISKARARAAPILSAQVTQAMQQLGMAGGRFEVTLPPCAQPQSHGLEDVEFLVAGHAGGTPRPLAKVASGGELSRLALAVAVTTAREDEQGAATLIFDEIDAGVGGSVADTVGRLMKQLGQERQVLAVTHLAQVAACADHHYLVTKHIDGQGSQARPGSHIRPVEGEERVAEVARMLGGERLGTSLAHAEQLLAAAQPPG